MEKANINWEVVHQKMASAQNKTNAKSIEEINIILHQRAHDLAQESELSNDQQSINIIEFILGNERYGIESTHISRVSEAKNITSLPCTPKFVEGIINIHGIIFCVINLKELFGLPKIKSNKLNRILIIKHDEVYLGIMADAVVGFESILSDSLQHTLPALAGIRSELLIGITHDQKIILNIQKLLEHKELMISDTI